MGRVVLSSQKLTIKRPAKEEPPMPQIITALGEIFGNSAAIASSQAPLTCSGKSLRASSMPIESKLFFINNLHYLIINFQVVCGNKTVFVVFYNSPGFLGD